jgi:hypothetical protein
MCMKSSIVVEQPRTVSSSGSRSLSEAEADATEFEVLAALSITH